MAFSTVIITAAGSGKRMGSSIPKQYMDLSGKPVIAWTIQNFEDLSEINEIILIVDKLYIDRAKEEIVEKYGFSKVTRIVQGGAERQDSVYNGLICVDDRADVILVHDGVRPFPPKEGIRLAINSAFDGRGGVLGIPVSDTIKRVDESQFVIETLVRSSLVSVQTPQIFQAEMLKMAFEQAKRDGFSATDEAMIVENAGFPVLVFPGNKLNIKITTAEDMSLAEAIINRIQKN